MKGQIFYCCVILIGVLYLFNDAVISSVECKFDYEHYIPRTLWSYYLYLLILCTDYFCHIVSKLLTIYEIRRLHWRHLQSLLRLRSLCLYWGHISLHWFVIILVHLFRIFARCVFFVFLHKCLLFIVSLDVYLVFVKCSHLLQSCYLVCVLEPRSTGSCLWQTLRCVLLEYSDSKYGRCD